MLSIPIVSFVERCKLLTIDKSSIKSPITIALELTLISGYKSWLINKYLLEDVIKGPSKLEIQPNSSYCSFVEQRAKHSLDSNDIWSSKMEIACLMTSLIPALTI